MVEDAGNAGESETEFKQLDFSGIRFPSDRLTIAMLRNEHPDLFDLGFHPGEEAQPKYFLQASHGGHAEDGIGNLLFCERLVATWAYAEARGIAGPKDWDLCTFKDELVDYYRKYGLASGIKHAAELIRDVERQGQLLAQQKGR
jgi:hypothetical protein